MKNKIIEQVKHAVRNPFAWPGGYPVFTVMADGALLCSQCAKENFRLIVDSTKNNLRDGWKAAGADILWEGTYFCGHCGEALESAYGVADNN